ncbi:MAG: DUF4446 family protein [Lachnospiraceae bacterium]|nr:DUF4446 family protein [Lachnospiraceae bacterium]
MESKILTFLNMDFDVFMVVVCVVMTVLLITIFFLLLDYLKIRKRYMEFMTGESGKSLEYTIYKRFREIDELKVNQKDNDDQIAIIYNKVRRSYSKIGMYRYDAFNIENSLSGGTMSFVLTLLNSANDGFMINTIHNRAGCHVYMKEIKNGTCDLALAEEEVISLNMALEYEDENIEK